MDRPLLPLAAALVAACAPSGPPAADRGENPSTAAAVPDDRGRILRGEDAQVTADWPARVTRTPVEDAPPPAETPR